MGILNDFKRQKAEQESALIEYLYERADRLTGAQLTELIRYMFLIFGGSGAGFFLIRILVKKINKHIGCSFEPKTKEHLEEWLTDVFAKTDHEKQKAIFVTAAFDVYQHNVVSAANLIIKIDEALKQLQNAPEFQNIGKNENENKKQGENKENG